MTERASYPIDAGLPLPKRRGGTNASTTTRYPFDIMLVGDSFLVPLTATNANGVSAAASEFKRLWPEREYETRRMVEDPVYKIPGTRVWRTR